jgi:hypothetical protein
MKTCKMVVGLFVSLYGVLLSTQSVEAQEKAAPGTAQVHMVITDTALQGDRELLRLRQDEVKPWIARIYRDFGQRDLPTLQRDRRAGRSSWDLNVGLSGLSKIAQETGGECYSLGTS